MVRESSCSNAYAYQADFTESCCGCCDSPRPCVGHYQSVISRNAQLAVIM